MAQQANMGAGGQNELGNPNQQGQGQTTAI